MIPKGSQRGGAAKLARHLMNALDNDHITLHDMRGFVADDLVGAFKEIEAISRGTRCRQFLFSLSLNPPELENAPPELFDQAIKDIEEKLGLVGQPRAVVFHDKNGRRHAHCVWSRIDTVKMRSINMPHFKRKLQSIARDLYLEHQWEMPAGFQNKQDRDPLSYGSVESEQAKRVKRDPKQVKSIFQKCWERSDSKRSFAQALAEQGYVLAQGDRRGFVAVDRDGEIYSIARWVGIKTKELRERLGTSDGLPSVHEALDQFEDRADENLIKDVERQKDKLRDDLLAFTKKRLSLANAHRAERTQLQDTQAEERKSFRASLEQSTTSGLKALWHRVSGFDAQQQSKIRSQQLELRTKHKREKQKLVQDQLKERRALQQEFYQLQYHNEIAVRHLWRNLGLNEDEYSTRKSDLKPSFCISDPSQPLII